MGGEGRGVGGGEPGEERKLILLQSTQRRVFKEKSERI